MLKQHTGVTEMVTVHRYLTQLCTSLTRQKKQDITQCWFIVGPALWMMAQYWIDIGFTSRVCCRKGGAFIVCSITAYKPYNCEGHSRFKKYCSVDIVTWKHHNNILIGLANIVSHVVLKWLQIRRIIKNKILIADILELEGLDVSDWQGACESN